MTWTLKSKITATALGLLFASTSSAQEFFRVYPNDFDYDGKVTIPYAIEHFPYIDFSKTGRKVKLHRADEDVDPTNYGTYLINSVDSITFPEEPEEYGKDKYKVFTLYVTTKDEAEIPYSETNKKYVDCYINIDGKGEYPNYSGPAQIRGRGNSTWRWYPKKPYRIKLDEGSKILGMGKDKDWVLLANYRDPTDVLNTYAFIVARKMGIPFTTPIRYVEVFLNKEYIGVYQIAEQIEQGNNRVDIADDGGILLTLDVDDGPYSPVPNVGDTCYFSSQIYGLPMAVKYPKDTNKAQREEIKAEFAILENALMGHDYDYVDSIMDIDSYIWMVMLNAFLDNDDFTAPRSTFVFKDVNGKWTWGPAWDFDAGYAFNWSPMMTSKTFFEGYTANGIVGNHPANHSAYYQAMFKSGRFTQRFIDKWNYIADSLLTSCWDETQLYIDGLQTRNGKMSPQERDLKRWPLVDDSGTKNPQKEIEKLKDWLKKRIDFMTQSFNALPILEDKKR